MRTPVILVAGQTDTDPVVGVLLAPPGTVVVEHRFDGHVVRRTLVTAAAWRVDDRRRLGSNSRMAACHAPSVKTCWCCCVSCTAATTSTGSWCTWRHGWNPNRSAWPSTTSESAWRPGYVDGPAALDVSIAAVVTCVDTSVWLGQALGDAGLDDGRTQAQVVVGQAEFADVVVLNRADPFAAAVLRRLSPRARIRVGADGIEHALDYLYSDARRGRSDDPHGPLLAGQPPLDSRGPINLVEFNARRPFHPQRLHACLICCWRA